MSFNALKNSLVPDVAATNIDEVSNEMVAAALAKQQEEQAKIVSDEIISLLNLHADAVRVRIASLREAKRALDNQQKALDRLENAKSIALGDEKNFAPLLYVHGFVGTDQDLIDQVPAEFKTGK